MRIRTILFVTTVTLIVLIVWFFRGCADDFKEQTIVIKLADNFYFSPSDVENNKSSLNLSNTYFDEAKRFSDSAGKSKDYFLEKNITLKPTQLLQILKDENLKLEFLFENDTIINHLASIIRNERNGHFHHPNFFNFFKIKCRNKFEVNNIRKKIVKLLKHISTNNQNNEAIVDYLYLSKPNKGTQAGGSIVSDNQDYLNDLKITEAQTLGHLPSSQRTTTNKNKAKGNGVKILTFDEGVHLQHEQYNAQFENDNNNEMYPSSHGDAVVGILCAKKDTDIDNCVGIVPRAKVRVIAYRIWSCDAIGYKQETESRLLYALSQTRTLSAIKYPILLMEIDRIREHLPIDVEPAVFFLTRLGIDLGISIIEAAGNGSDKNLNLDSVYENITGGFDSYNQIYQSNATTTITGTTARRFSDVDIENGNAYISFYKNNSSGVVLVGGYNSSKQNMYNYDSRGLNESTSKIKIFAQGDNINSTRYNCNEETPSGYHHFDGTSGASAIMTGFVASMYGYAKYKNKILTPQKVKELLETTESDIKIIKHIDTEDIQIGVVPNLINIYEKIDDI